MVIWQTKVHTYLSIHNFIYIYIYISYIYPSTYLSILHSSFNLLSIYLSTYFLHFIQLLMPSIIHIYKSYPIINKFYLHTSYISHVFYLSSHIIFQLHQTAYRRWNKVYVWICKIRIPGILLVSWPFKLYDLHDLLRFQTFMTLMTFQVLWP